MPILFSVGKHEGVLKDISQSCSYGDSLGQKQAARILSAFVPNRCTLVPMPSHIGYATTMLSLCKWIQYYINEDTGLKDVEIWDGLVCDPHESCHIAKLRNEILPKIKMYLKKKPPKKETRVIIIDNTIASGVTAKTALDVLPDATVLTLTKGE